MELRLNGGVITLFYTSTNECDLNVPRIWMFSKHIHYVFFAVPLNSSYPDIELRLNEETICSDIKTPPCEKQVWCQITREKDHNSALMKNKWYAVYPPLVWFMFDEYTSLIWYVSMCLVRNFF